MKLIYTVSIAILITSGLLAETGYQKEITSADTTGSLTAASDTGNTVAKSASGENIAFSGVNLPLMIITTHGKTIERSPRVMVDMALIYNSVLTEYTAGRSFAPSCRSVPAEGNI